MVGGLPRVSAHQIRVWTYWEGPKTAFQELCEHSVARQVGNLWHPISLENVGEWLTLPKKVLEHHSCRVRSDYIRTALLYEYGGIWLDSDVLLLKNVLSFVRNKPVAWREQPAGRKRERGPSIGALVFPLPGHPFLQTCLQLYEERLKETFHHSMGLYYSAWLRDRESIELLGWEDFYAVPARDWKRFWCEPDLLDLTAVGLHLWASAIKPTSRLFKSLATVETLVEHNPKSVLAEYARRFVLGTAKGGSRENSA